MKQKDALLFMPDKNTLRVIRDNFVHELELAARGEHTSLAFIRTPLLSEPLVKEGELFQVFVVGGSVIQTALLVKKAGAATLLEKHTDTLSRLTDAEVLFSLLAEYLDARVSKIVMDFAYPLEPVLRGNVLDGKLIKGSKEHELADLVGKCVGEKFENFLSVHKGKSTQVSAANDTVCLILSGVSRATGDGELGQAHGNWQSLVGGIVGTGMNFGFFLDEHTVVNLEAGNFNRFTPTETGPIIDKSSSSPGDQLFEKEIAGAYLFEHYNAARKMKGSSRGFISFTHELSELADAGDMLARRVLDRSAMFIAAMIAGIWRFKGLPELAFVMEGSLFWSGSRYRECVSHTLSELDIPEGGVSFFRREYGSIMGAADLIC